MSPRLAHPSPCPRPNSPWRSQSTTLHQVITSAKRRRGWSPNTEVSARPRTVKRKGCGDTTPTRETRKQNTGDRTAYAKLPSSRRPSGGQLERVHKQTVLQANLERVGQLQHHRRRRRRVVGTGETLGIDNQYGCGSFRHTRTSRDKGRGTTRGKQRGGGVARMPDSWRDTQRRVSVHSARERRGAGQAMSCIGCPSPPTIGVVASPRPCPCVVAVAPRPPRLPTCRRRKNTTRKAHSPHNHKITRPLRETAHRHPIQWHPSRTVTSSPLTRS